MGAVRHEAHIQRLRTLERELSESLARDEEQARSSPQPDVLDVGDRAVDEYSKETSLSELDQNRRQLSLVQEALARADGGVYGICAACGQPIEEKRLDAVPWAEYCIRDQEHHDQGLL